MTTLLASLILILGVQSGPRADSAGPPAVAVADTKPRPAPGTPGAPARTPGAAMAEEIDREPYRIALHLALDPRARIDEARRRALLKQWQALVHRFVGPPWIVTVIGPPSPLASGRLEALEASSLATLGSSFDKIWLVRISEGGAAGLVFTGREYDTATRWLGPLQEHQASVLADAPRALLEFALELFNPTAYVTGQEGGRALLKVRGASITPASAAGRVVAKDSVFIPLRLVSKRDQSVVILRVPFSYLRVEEVQGPVARCAIVSALRDPLTSRVPLPNTLVAIGIKPGTSPIRLKFVTRGDKSPAAGYTLVARSVPDGVPHELGMTDRSGRIVLKPGFARGLVILRLLAANVEPVAEFPVMPGERSDERAIPIDPKPLSVSYQVKLDAIRDQVIDLVAQRARLEKRMEARLQGEDFAGLEQGLKEYLLLPRKDVYADRISKLKDEAARQQAQSKSEVLSKNIQARFNEIQALIDRYLDDDAVSTYTEALERKRAEKAGVAKAASKASRSRDPAAAPSAAAPANPAGTPDTGPPARKRPQKPAAPAPGAPPF